MTLHIDDVNSVAALYSFKRILNIRTVWVEVPSLFLPQTFPPIGKNCPVTTVHVTVHHLGDLPVLSMRIRFEWVLLSGEKKSCFLFRILKVPEYRRQCK